jgi:hypothetical protein
VSRELNYSFARGVRLIIALIVVVGVALPIWASVEAAGKPADAFERAGTSRTFWVVVPVVAILLCAPVAVVLAITWFASYRKRVVAASLGEDPVG